MTRPVFGAALAVPCLLLTTMAGAQTLHRQQQVVIDVVLAGAVQLVDVEIVQAKICAK